MYSKFFKESLMLKKYLSCISILSMYYLQPALTKPESDVDTPEYHYKVGMRAVENMDYQQAIKSFSDRYLDSKFALGFGGLGLANAKLGNNKEAKKFASTCASKGSKDSDALALSARIWIDMRESENGSIG